MPTRPATALAAVALAASLVVLSVAPASALISRPPPGDPPDRPTTTQRRPTTTAPAPAPRTLQSLSVTTDSVVATATVHYNGTPGYVTVGWGDGTISSRDPQQPSDPRPQPNPDPPGTLTLRHTYAAPSDGAAFSVTITATAANAPTETQGTTVTVSPRYRITGGQARLQPTSACDSVVETEAEFHIEQRGDLLPVNTWDITAHNSDFGPYQLPGSAFAVDMTAADTRRVLHKVTELDPINDDLGNTVTLTLRPDMQTGTTSMTWDDYGYPDGYSGCSARIFLEIGVNLITPSAGGGPVATQ